MVPGMDPQGGVSRWRLVKLEEEVKLEVVCTPLSNICHLVTNCTWTRISCNNEYPSNISYVLAKDWTKQSTSRLR